MTPDPTPLTAVGLTEAWNRVERLLPEAWRLDGVKWRPDVALKLTGHDESKRWQAGAVGPAPEVAVGRGSTPAMALNHLADLLEKQT